MKKDKVKIATAWKFNKIIPDWEDISACNFAYIDAEPRIAEGLEAGDIFNIGFYRGIAWLKYRQEQEATNRSKNKGFGSCNQNLTVLKNK